MFWLEHISRPLCWLQGPFENQRRKDYRYVFVLMNMLCNLMRPSESNTGSSVPVACYFPANYVPAILSQPIAFLLKLICETTIIKHELEESAEVQTRIGGAVFPFLRHLSMYNVSYCSFIAENIYIHRTSEHKWTKQSSSRKRIEKSRRNQKSISASSHGSNKLA